VSSYLLAQLAVNAVYGTLADIGLYFLGVPNPVLWGVFAALLRYLPSGHLDCRRAALRLQACDWSLNNPANQSSEPGRAASKLSIHDLCRRSGPRSKSARAMKSQ
jgi:hypothetical protein